MSPAELDRLVADFQLDQPQHAHDFVLQHGVEATLASVVRVLRGRNPGDVFTALGVVRDAALCEADDASRLRAAIRATICPELDALLSAPNLALRTHAVYALGKLSMHDQAFRLEAIAEHTLQHDPMLLPRLLFELRWLHSPLAEPLLERALRSDEPLIRWAALRETPESRWPLFADDPYEPLAAEVRHRLDELELSAAAKAAGHRPRRTWRQRATELEARKPLGFDDVEVRFSNRLGTSSGALDEVRGFVQGLLAAAMH